MELRYPWLPADDEANVLGFWVPSPEEIAHRIEAIHRGEIQVKTAHSPADRELRRQMQRENLTYKATSK